MVDVHKSATLRGFHVSVAHIGDQMYLCHPLLSFEGDSTRYLANRLDWRNDPGALTIADPSEASARGTLLPPTYGRPIASGEGLVAVGARFVQTAAAAEAELFGSEILFARVDDSEGWIGVATPALYMALRTRSAEKARAVFDEALGGCGTFEDNLKSVEVALREIRRNLHDHQRRRWPRSGKLMVDVKIIYDGKVEQLNGGRLVGRAHGDCLEGAAGG